MSESTARVGVLGLGAIGLPIAQRLRDAGFDVAVHDADPARASLIPGAEAGAEAVLGCGTLCVVTPDEAALLDLIQDGGELRTGAVETVILVSTVLPERARETSALLADRDILLVEAPVSGGPERAREGELTVLVGSDADASPARPVIDALASRVFPVGRVGAASAVKLANQLVLFSALTALHDGLALAAANGVSEEDALAVFAESTGDTWAGRHLAFFDELAQSYDEAGTPAESRPWRKDLAEFARAALDAGVDASHAAALVAGAGDRIEAHARTSGQPETNDTTTHGGNE